MSQSINPPFPANPHRGSKRAKGFMPAITTLDPFPDSQVGPLLTRARTVPRLKALPTR